jgi:dTDP-4-dehydrorhamnose reductase
VTGGDGQLGQCLRKSQPSGLEARYYNRSEFDLTDVSAMSAVLEAFEPAYIVNCAAYTNVDGAEDNEETAAAINASGVGELATLALKLDIKVIHISTDFVFDGKASAPYSPKAQPNPEGAYGRTKLDGEHVLRDKLPDASMVIRTSWLYSEFGGNFVKTMLRLFETKESFQVVEDQKGTPTYGEGIAKLIWHIVATDSLRPGIFHWSDSGVTSWYEFAKTIGEQGLAIGLLSRRAELGPILAADYGSAAPRPAFSVLDCTDTTDSYPDVPQTQWQENLDLMLSNLRLMSS